MTIQVIKKPIAEQSIRDIDCRWCGAGLRFDVKTDARLVKDTRDGDAYVVVCPCCEKENWLATR